MFSLEGKDASKPAVNWFQFLSVRFTKEYLPTSVLCFLVLIFRLWLSLLSYHVFRCLSPIDFQARLPVYDLKKGAYSGCESTLFQSCPNRLIYIIWKLAALFYTRFKALTWPCLYGPNTPLHTQVSVSQVPYKLNVSYHYFLWVYVLWNEMPSMLFVVCTLHDVPSLDRCVKLFLNTESYLPLGLSDPKIIAYSFLHCSFCEAYCFTFPFL